jgi:hypothetical protein
VAAANCIYHTSWGVKIRFFYAKEIVPGSARDNSTGYWFTTWVNIKKTTPVEISTPEVLKRLLGQHVQFRLRDSAHYGIGFRRAALGFC